MIKGISSSLICFLSLTAGCCSTRMQQATQHSIIDSTAPAIHKQKLSQPTTLQSNISAITATVNTIAPLDSINYRLSIRITQVAAEGETPSFAEAGQEVTVTPQYVLTDGGTVDTTVGHNRKLLGLKTISSGENFQGKISLTSTGQWMLLEVTNR
ncbi:MAG: hypothetical protein HYR76_07175 [Ignavibacteria bacterium]|nr:hypothetical protein [Ignavibacteria bacterium]MBI3765329.1 hypothetical protein [Ignavibacteriales bacterium]